MLQRGLYTRAEHFLLGTKTLEESINWLFKYIGGRYHIRDKYFLFLKEEMEMEMEAEDQVAQAHQV